MLVGVNLELLWGAAIPSAIETSGTDHGLSWGRGPLIGSGLELYYEHLEYFPFGEAWVEENRNTQRTPYLFTAKELDEETGLYYFGARYYESGSDPERLSRRRPFGGVFISNSLNLYGYSVQNPIKYRDEDGEFVNFLVGAAVGVAIDAAVQGVLIAAGAQEEFSFSSLAISAAAGATGVGLTSVVAKASKLSRAAKAGVELAADVSLTAAEQAVRDGKVSVTGAVTEALLGQGAGQIGKRVADRVAPAARGVGGGSGRTLYRAVGPDEMADLRATSGRYRVPAGGSEGKYFFETPEQASNFARMMGDQPYTTTSVRVSPS